MSYRGVHQNIKKYWLKTIGNDKIMLHVYILRIHIGNPGEKPRNHLLLLLLTYLLLMFSLMNLPHLYLKLYLFSLFIVSLNNGISFNIGLIYWFIMLLLINTSAQCLMKINEWGPPVCWVTVVQIWRQIYFIRLLFLLRSPFFKFIYFFVLFFLPPSTSQCFNFSVFGSDFICLERYSTCFHLDLHDGANLVWLLTWFQTLYSVF